MQLHEGLYKGPDGEALRFYIEAEENPAASNRAGRPIFDECLYVEVITPGSRESAPVFLVERKYAEEVGIAAPQRGPKYEQYKPQVELYRNGSMGGTDVRGTPLAAWPRMTAALVATAHYAGIYTVEALAALPDSRFSAFGPGARNLVEQAKAFCEAADGNAPTERLAAENAELRADVNRLTDMVKQLGAAHAGTQEGKDAALQAVADEHAVVEPAVEQIVAAVEPAVEPVVEPVVAAPKAKAGGGNALPII